ncbi:MAG TPA: DMT family transporter [Chthoniobacteraceae bacterium]|nr:DMT family transporter [Chthoniobacteraceae bacterium]
MLAAFLATIFYALSSVFATRSARLLGAVKANLGRMTLALLLLGLWAHLCGQGLRGGALGWFLVSGIIGYGFGDICLFQALPRIGPRLTMIIIHCLAVPLAAMLEMFWLGNALHLREVACICVILAGVYIALTPVRHFNIKASTFRAGTIFAFGASLAQAGSTIISRKANLVADSFHTPIDGATAAYQRMIGGIATTIIFTLVMKGFQSRSAANAPVPPATAEAHQRKNIGWLFVVMNAVAGPTLGVAFFQRAVSQLPGAIVQPVVSTTPVFTIPLAYWIDGDRPSARSIAGGIIAVVGTVLLAISLNR